MRMNRERLQIGAYCLAPYAHTMEHVREIAECGIDVMLCVPNDRALLDKLADQGVGAVVSGAVPGWFGGQGEQAGQMAIQNPLEEYERAARQFEDHPAVWGIDIGDEPSSLDFPHYGKVFDCVRRLFPNQFPYLNLYPGYAMVPWNTPEEKAFQLGTSDYAEYIERYCRSVASDYICFDFYPYAADVEGFLSNLHTVSEACRKYGRSLWVVLQVNSHRPEVWTSENRMRFQAYAAMAFGAESIFWACYTAGWWYHQVLDEQGNRTEQYDKLRRVNGELHGLGAEYMKFRCVKTHIIDGEPLDTGTFRQVCAEDGERLIVGEMASRCDDGRTALMICAAGDPQDEHPHKARIHFKSSKRIRAFGGAGEIEITPEAGGGGSLAVESCAGVLLTCGNGCNSGLG